jgi:hypothetical protein
VSEALRSYDEGHVVVTVKPEQHYVHVCIIYGMAWVENDERPRVVLKLIEPEELVAHEERLAEGTDHPTDHPSSSLPSLPSSSIGPLVATTSPTVRKATMLLVAWLVFGFLTGVLATWFV